MKKYLVRFNLFLKRKIYPVTLPVIVTSRSLWLVLGLRCQGGTQTALFCSRVVLDREGTM
jgi:hypothetical protein